MPKHSNLNLSQVDIVENFETSDDLGKAKAHPERRKSHLKGAGYDRRSLPYRKLFRFATPVDFVAIAFGLVFVAVASLGLPYVIILYGEFTTLLIDRTVGIGTSTPTVLLKWFGGGRILTNASYEENMVAILEDSKAFGISNFVGCIVWLIVLAISIDLLNGTALRQITAIRKRFLEAVLRQDMTWYDLNTNESFAVKLTEDLDKLKDGIGEKVSIFVYLVLSFLISIVIAFIYGWKLTLVVLSCAPIMIGMGVLVSNVQTKLAEKEMGSYSMAGGIAEEVLSSIRTVFSYGGQAKEIDRYAEKLVPAAKNGEKKAIWTGLGGGIAWLLNYCVYGLAFWYGVELILEDRYKEDKVYTPSTLVIVLFGILAGAQNLGMTTPLLDAFAAARASAAAVFSVIARRPEIDSLSEEGIKPQDLYGDIQFSGVYFRYPARSDVEILKGLNLTVNSGQTVALVGPSGCGKSTCLQLLQRLYDPLHGFITIDGIRIKDMNTYYLRSFMGFVGQEPVLFDATIAENIRYGCPTATQDEIERAAKIANCHKLIVNLPHGYETRVGERGAQLSGGQKQRIAIARALIRNPRILLLDEATSALDPNSEKKVQKALEKASEGRTTIVIAHRLSTIVNADKIVLVDRGVAVEEGNHQELMELQGQYYEMVKARSESTMREEQKTRPKRSRKYSLMSDSTAMSSDDSDDEKEKEKVGTKDEEKYPAPLFRLLKINSPEWCQITFGSLSAIVVGASSPIFAILFGGLYGILSLDDPAEVRDGSRFYSLLFVALGVATGLGTFLQAYLLSIAGVRLTTRLRRMTFKSMVGQDVAWFDDANNSVGALSARLAGDCAAVQGATGIRIGYMVQALSTIVIGVAVGLSFSWKLTLVAVTAVPIILASVFLESKYMHGSAMKEKEAIEAATKIAVEAISNIRTVASLGQEPYVVKRYEIEIDKANAASKKKTLLRGSVYAFGQTAPMFGYALALWYGGVMVSNGELDYENAIKVSEALLFGVWMLGQALAYAPNVSAGMLSAGRILKLLDTVPSMYDPPRQPWHDNWESEGTVAFKDVRFRYPTRQNIQVLQGLDLDVIKGQTVALVGPSGCGKSTCIQLLLRYYDQESGEIRLDGTPIDHLPISLLRAQMGLVSQEPVLFDRTIADNIAYGDNSRSVPMPEIIEAARSANIHEFVTALPLGYETELGAKGTQLSGGQKQRIAIARALVRNPRLLLLDEATSALDNQSEKVVQAALDQAAEGRTCIVIAHRLTTVREADVICVLQDGQIVESGTHDELMATGKIYAKMYAMQQVE